MDVSNCSITDRTFASITNYCRCIEVLGLRNLREVEGTPLVRLFQDGERAKNITAVTLSGSKKVHLMSCINSVWRVMVSHAHVIQMAGLMSQLI